MLTFRVDDMTCGHCASTITKAVQAAEPGATVEVDLARGVVRVECGATPASRVAAAISDAGYSPVRVSGAKAKTGGCCCGSGRSSCGA